MKQVASCIVLGLLVGCKAASAPSPTPPAAPVATPAAPAPVAEPETEPELVVARHGGVGATLFTLELHADGRVVYDGVNLVAVKGKRSGRIDAEYVRSIKAALTTLEEQRKSLLECQGHSVDDGNAFVISVAGEGSPLRFSGELDRSCPGNAAWAELIGHYETILSTSGARDWVGNTVL